MGVVIYFSTSKLHVSKYINTSKYSNMSKPSISYFNTILGTSIKAANHAGKMVRDVMQGGDLGIVEKTGADDLQTAADRAANAIILGSLTRAIPNLEVIGEEGIASASID